MYLFRFSCLLTDKWKIFVNAREREQSHETWIDRKLMKINMFRIIVYCNANTNQIDRNTFLQNKWTETRQKKEKEINHTYIRNSIKLLQWLNEQMELHYIVVYYVYICICKICK